MDYQIIQSGDITEFEETVRREINSGWVPQGGVSAVLGWSTGEYIYFQAMTRTSEVSNKND